MEAASVTAAGHEALVASGPLNRLRSDRRLVDRYRDGDEGAFATLYDRYHARVEAICLGVLGSRHDAQDAAQETFASAAQQLRGERPPLELKAWLGRVARNAAIDVARRRRATTQLPVDAPAPDAEPAGRLQRRADLDALVSALQTLPERQRSALVLRELGGLSYAEIGAALKSDEPVVRGLISRARMGLRHELEAGDLACAHVREHLADEIDGRRRPTEVRRHLRGCSDCRSFGVDMRGDARALRGLAPSFGLGLIGAFLFRPVRPVLIGGAAAKAFFAPPILQAVLACAVCVGAAETVVHVAPASHRAAPRHVKAVDSAPVVRAAVTGSPVAAAQTSYSATNSAGDQSGGGGSGSSTVAADRQAAALKRKAAGQGPNGDSGRNGDGGKSGRSGGGDTPARRGTGSGALVPPSRSGDNSPQSPDGSGDATPSTPTSSGSGSGHPAESDPARSSSSGHGREGDPTAPVHESDTHPAGVPSSSKPLEPVDPPEPPELPKP